MRECEYCGKSIVYKNGHARFCSDKCRNYARRRFMRSPLPQPILDAARWVRYDPNKRPLTTNGAAASSTNPSTWSTWASVQASSAGVGLGFVLGDGIGCIDLDHCLIDGEPNDEARRILEQYPNNYVEVSPSGDGLHIWGGAEEQPGRRFTTNGGLHVEFYSTGRYITVTENVYQHGKLHGIGVPVIPARADLTA